MELPGGCCCVVFYRGSSIVPSRCSGKVYIPLKKNEELEDLKDLWLIMVDYGRLWLIMVDYG